MLLSKMTKKYFIKNILINYSFFTKTIQITY
jgi:hypothetical protein